MNDPRPAPLVPPEVDLGANDWFPLYHRRLPKSRWWRSASDMARSRNVDLWCYAYGETPAGSLPDDDLELAEAAGFGRDLAAFMAAKAEILSPWTLCADGRWYHPALCEVVLEAWERTGERRRQARLRQQAHRQRIRSGQPEAQNATSPDALSNAPSDATTDPREGHALPGGLSRVTPPLVTRFSPIQTDRTDKPLSQNAPSAHATGGRLAQPWKGDPEFLAVWNASTDLMRRRAKSKAVAWAAWVKVRKAHDGARILAGLRVYLRGDPDVSRTGGPGLHIWLRDLTFDSWAGDDDGDPLTSWSPERWEVALALFKKTGRWGETLGPEPGKPGCKVPAESLQAAGLSLRVVAGAA